jgi:hypothetical protein
MKTFLAVAFVLTAHRAFAVNAPPPSKPYPQPIIAFTGRFIDDTMSVRRDNVARRIDVVPELNRVYVVTGDRSLAVYSLPRFVAESGSLTTAFQTNGQWLIPDYLIAPGFVPLNTTPRLDGEGLGDFTWDSRGYTYAAFKYWGFAIVSPDGTLVSQTYPPDLIDVSSAVAFASGGKFYLAIAGSAHALIYDVTSPAAPVLVGPAPVFFFYSAIRVGDTVVVRTDSDIQFYTSAAMAAGGLPFRTVAGRSTSIASDGLNVYSSVSPFAVLVIPISGAPMTQIPLSARVSSLNYGGGYLSAAAPGDWLWLLRIANGVVTATVDLSPYVRANEPTDNFVFPGAAPFVLNGHTYLALGADRRGDLFELQPALAAPTVAMRFANDVARVGSPDRLTITLTNPNATALTGVAFTDSFPTNLVNASTPNAATTCGGTVVAVPSGATLALTGGTVPAGGACTVSVDLLSTTAASYINTIAPGGVTTANGVSNATGASANVLVATDVPTLSSVALLLVGIVLAAVAVVRLYD